MMMLLNVGLIAIYILFWIPILTLRLLCIHRILSLGVLARLIFMMLLLPYSIVLCLSARHPLLLLSRCIMITALSISLGISVIFNIVLLVLAFYLRR